MVLIRGSLLRPSQPVFLLLVRNESSGAGRVCPEFRVALLWGPRRALAVCEGRVRGCPAPHRIPRCPRSPAWQRDPRGCLPRERAFPISGKMAEPVARGRTRFSPSHPAQQGGGPAGRHENSGPQRPEARNTAAASLSRRLGITAKPCPSEESVKTFLWGPMETERTLPFSRAPFCLLKRQQNANSLGGLGGQAG